MNNEIALILDDMTEYLNASQIKQLQKVLIKRIHEQPEQGNECSNARYLEMFLMAKRIEGCSERTIAYYKVTAEKMLSNITKPLRKMTTEDLRSYLSFYQSQNGCSKITVDNVRRNLSSFFSWLAEEDHILKSPIRRIHKIKSKTTVKETITDENIEKLRDGCVEVRDLAIIDLLYSTGIRVGELVNLDIEDINFEERECIVYGKGDKERKVYFDARTKLHLQLYLQSRSDDNRALFVTLDKPHARLKKRCGNQGTKTGQKAEYGVNSSTQIQANNGDTNHRQRNANRTGAETARTPANRYNDAICYGKSDKCENVT